DPRHQRWLVRPDFCGPVPVDFCILPEPPVLSLSPNDLPPPEEETDVTPGCWSPAALKVCILPEPPGWILYLPASRDLKPLFLRVVVAIALSFLSDAAGLRRTGQGRLRALEGAGLGGRWSSRRTTTSPRRGASA